MNEVVGSNAEVENPAAPKKNIVLVFLDQKKSSILDTPFSSW